MKNLNRVPKKQWRKWSKVAKTAFNRTYTFMFYNQKVVTHPKMENINPRQWKTIAWNAAWIAADAVDNTIPTVVVDV